MHHDIHALENSLNYLVNLIYLYSIEKPPISPSWVGKSLKSGVNSLAKEELKEKKWSEKVWVRDAEQITVRDRIAIIIKVWIRNTLKV